MDDGHYNNTMDKIWLAAIVCFSGVAPLAAQVPRRPVVGPDLPLVADAALKGLETRVRILSGLESKQVTVMLDSAFLPPASRASAQSALQRAVPVKGAAGAPISYRLTLRSFEMLSDSTAKAISTLETRPTGGCDTKTLAVMLVKREGRWQSNLVLDVVAPECKRAS